LDCGEVSDGDLAAAVLLIVADQMKSETFVYVSSGAGPGDHEELLRRFPEIGTADRA
jgi:hypothetical protein